MWHFLPANLHLDVASQLAKLPGYVIHYDFKSTLGLLHQGLNFQSERFNVWDWATMSASHPSQHWCQHTGIIRCLFAGFYPLPKDHEHPSQCHHQLPTYNSNCATCCWQEFHWAAGCRSKFEMGKTKPTWLSDCLKTLWIRSGFWGPDLDSSTHMFKDNLVSRPLAQTSESLLHRANQPKQKQIIKAMHSLVKVRCQKEHKYGTPLPPTLFPLVLGPPSFRLRSLLQN